MNNEMAKSDKEKADDKAFPGYPQYPASEDITNNEQEVPLEEDMDAQRPFSDAGKPAMAPGENLDETALKNGDPLVTSDDSNVSDEERALLDKSERGLDGSDDEMAPARAHLDETDLDGDLLNEAAGREGFLGDDLEVPGSELDDADENIGEEDEENNYYSLSDNEERNEPDNG
jgi:hypothetical protein